MKVRALFILMTVLAGACQPNSTTDNHTTATAKKGADTNPVADLEEQVMAVHDSVMPKLSDVMRLKKAVSAKVAQTSGEAAKEQGMAINRQLDEADKAMMGWMYQYNGDTLGKLDQAKAVEYLKDQQAKVNAVRNQMQKSIAEAEKYL